MEILMVALQSWMIDQFETTHKQQRHHVYGTFWEYANKMYYTCSYSVIMNSMVGRARKSILSI